MALCTVVHLVAHGAFKQFVELEKSVGRAEYSRTSQDAYLLHLRKDVHDKIQPYEFQGFLSNDIMKLLPTSHCAG